MPPGIERNLEVELATAAAAAIAVNFYELLARLTQISF